MPHPLPSTFLGLDGPYASTPPEHRLLTGCQPPEELDSASRRVQRPHGLCMGIAQCHSMNTDCFVSPNTQNSPSTHFSFPILSHPPSH